MESDPLVACTQVMDSKGVLPSDCSPSLWCREVGSGVWESLGEQDSGDCWPFGASLLFPAHG